MTVMDGKPANNPFENEKLHLTVDPAKPELTQERTPFNDAIKHGDVVQGFQAPKRLEQYPVWYRNPRRIYATISVLVFALFLVYQVIRVIAAIASGK